MLYTVLNDFRVISHFILSLILQMSKLRLRKERSLARSCSASRVLHHHSHPLLCVCKELLPDVGIA